MTLNCTSSHSTLSLSQELLQPRVVVPTTSPLQAKSESLDVKWGNVPMIDMIDITGEDEQQQQPINVLEELDKTAMTLMKSGVAAKQPETIPYSVRNVKSTSTSVRLLEITKWKNQPEIFPCEKCKMCTGQALLKAHNACGKVYCCTYCHENIIGTRNRQYT